MKWQGFTLLCLAVVCAACMREGAPPPADDRKPAGRPCVNLNTATEEDLNRLPGVGEVTARRIVEHRERHGPFRRPEEIIIIEGFSEKRYRAIADRLCAE